MTRIAGKYGDYHMWIWMGGWTSSAHISANVWCEDHSGFWRPNTWNDGLHTYGPIGNIWKCVWKYDEETVDVCWIWETCWGNDLADHCFHLPAGSSPEYGKHHDAAVDFPNLLPFWLGWNWDLGGFPQKIRQSNVGLLGTGCISGVVSSEPMSSWHIYWILLVVPWCN